MTAQEAFQVTGGDSLIQPEAVVQAVKQGAGYRAADCRR